MAKPSYYVPCEHCKGTGQREVSGVYLDTLVLMLRLCRDGRYIVANRDANKFGCKPTALNNRLRRLEELGLAVSEWHGRQHRFYLPTGNYK